jgi:hypothetical protein
MTNFLDTKRLAIIQIVNHEIDILYLCGYISLNNPNDTKQHFFIIGIFEALLATSQFSQGELIEKDSINGHGHPGLSGVGLLHHSVKLRLLHQADL